MVTTRLQEITQRSNQTGYKLRTPQQLGIYNKSKKVLVNSRNISNKNQEWLNDQNKQLVDINEKIWRLENELDKNNHHVYHIYAMKGPSKTNPRAVFRMIRERIQLLKQAQQNTRNVAVSQNIAHQINQYNELKPSYERRRGVHPLHLTKIHKLNVSSRKYLNNYKYDIQGSKIKKDVDSNPKSAKILSIPIRQLLRHYNQFVRDHPYGIWSIRYLHDV